jgi:hypothetical protein
VTASARAQAVGLPWIERRARLLFDLDADGRIAAVNEPEPEPPPRLWLARASGGSLLIGRADIPGDVVARARSFAAKVAPWDGAPLSGEAMAELESVVGGEVEAGPAFAFDVRVEVPAVVGLIHARDADAELLREHFPYTLAWLAARSPVVGVERDGAIVSACYSARTRPDACEAGVATTEAWQGQGFARAVVAAWRDAVESSGRTPFYSTSWNNTASLAVARHLHLVAVAEELSVG